MREGPEDDDALLVLQRVVDQGGDGLRLGPADLSDLALVVGEMAGRDLPQACHPHEAAGCGGRVSVAGLSGVVLLAELDLEPRAHVLVGLELLRTQRDGEDRINGVGQVQALLLDGDR